MGASLPTYQVFLSRFACYDAVPFKARGLPCISADISVCNGEPTASPEISSGLVCTTGFINTEDGSFSRRYERREYSKQQGQWIASGPNPA